MFGIKSKTNIAMKVGLKKQYDEGILLIKNMKKLFKFIFIDFKPASKWGIFAKGL